MKTADQRLQDAIDAQNEPVDGQEIRRELEMLESDHHANVADHRVALIAIIMLVGLVVYQVWEMLQ